MKQGNVSPKGLVSHIYSNNISTVVAVVGKEAPFI